MKKYIFALLSAATFMTSGCDSILERPELTKPLDETYGKTDNEYRLYVNEAYPVYFVGYNNSWGSAYAPLRGYNFSDDNASSGKQTSFENTVPTSRGSYNTSDLAKILKEDTTTDIAIIGHTDKVGTYEANMKVSKNRAYAVENYLQDCGVSPSQFKQVEGVGYNEYDESLSASENRRVVIFMYASEQMIKNAEAGK